MENKIKNIVACGCSHAYGFYYNTDTDYKFNINYNSIVADHMNAKVVNLAKPGATNYMIAKQIEYSIGLNPDLVIINVTNPLRLSLILDRERTLKDIPSLEDFNYESFTNEITKNFRPIIKTVPRTSLLSAKTTNKDHLTVIEYGKSFMDSYLLMDQDRMMLSYAMDLLKKHNINYIWLDLSHLDLSNMFNNMVSLLPMKEILKKFNIENDPHHFNQDGHHYIAKEIINYINNYET